MSERTSLRLPMVSSNCYNKYLFDYVPWDIMSMMSRPVERFFFPDDMLLSITACRRKTAMPAIDAMATPKVIRSVFRSQHPYEEDIVSIND